MISFHIEKPDIQAMIKKLLPTPTDAKNLLFDVRSTILKRTTQGMDVNGTNFEAYSKSYKDWKESKGRQVGKVDLTFHNRMLSSLAVLETHTGAELYFADGERRKIAYYHNTGSRVPQREFFGVADNEWRRLLETMYQNISRRSGL